MTPEQQAALKSLLESQGGNADAGQDYDQICQVVEEKLAPVFEMIGNEFKNQRNEINELKDIIYKMVTSFHDAVGSQKRSGIESMISSKYGADLEALKPVYADFRGGDIVSDLLDALADQDGDHDEMAGSFIEAAKGKYGKYLGAGKPSVEVSVESGQTLGDDTAEEPMEEKAESTDPVEIMKRKVLALRGRKTA